MKIIILKTFRMLFNRVPIFTIVLLKCYIFLLLKNKIKLHINQNELTVESKTDNFSLTFAYPVRVLPYLKRGLINQIKDYKYRYPLPNFNSKHKKYNIIDCGANIGEFTLSFIEKYPNSKIFSFEPSPNEFSILQKNTLKYDNIECFNTALGESSKEAEFYISTDTADSSLIEPAFYTKKITVKVKKLDDFYKDINIKTIDLIKIEAEGGEPEVLLSGKNILKNTKFVSVDWGPERGIEEENTLNKVSNILFALNFEMVVCYDKNYTVLFKNKSFKDID